MTGRLYNFDIGALHATLDTERRARGLSWIELTAEINKPFDGTSSIPISVGTIRDMRSKRSVAGAVALQILRWLGQAPERFLSGRNVAPEAEEMLPEPGPSRILRFDTRALYTALNTKRTEQGRTWQQLADDLPGFTAGMLRNLAKNPLIGFPRVMTLTQWLRRPAASFVRDYRR